jgi:HAD superfamily hydrolase (TIGR01509 family)
MVKTIFFDFWGTLVENGIYSPVKQVKYILGLRMPFSEYVIRFEKSFMCQKNENLTQGFKRVLTEFGIKDDNKIDELIGLWNKSWMLAKPYNEVKEKLEMLGQKYQLILISNTDNVSINNVLDKFDLRKYFDKIYFSYELGMIKSDEQFLKTILEKENLNKKDCLVVGDSIKSDILSAQQNDVDAVLIDRKNSREFHPKIITLNDLEEYIKTK